MGAGETKTKITNKNVYVKYLPSMVEKIDSVNFKIFLFNLFYIEIYNTFQKPSRNGNYEM